MADQHFQHAFFILCDSHGLQLLIKDLLHLPSMQEVFTAASNIVTYFQSSPKQQDILHKMQLQEYGKHYSFIASIIMCWGTQYFMLNSVQ